MHTSCARLICVLWTRIWLGHIVALCQGLWIPTLLRRRLLLRCRLRGHGMSQMCTNKCSHAGQAHEYACRYTYWNKTWMSIAVAFWAQARVAFECAAAYLRTQASTCTKTRSPVNILLSYTHPVGYTKLTWTSRASSSKDSSSTGGLFRLPHANVAYQEVCTRLNFVDSHNWIIKFANRPCDKYTTWFNMDYSDKDRHILSLVFAHKQRCVR